MGTKKNRREGHKKQKLNNEVNLNPLKDVTVIHEDSSIESLGKGFILNNDVVYKLEGDANLNNHEIGKRKKKKKSDHSDADVETQKIREQDEVVEKDGNDGNDRKMLEKNIIKKVAKHGSGIEAENDVGEGRPRAKDGRKDEKKRKNQKREKVVGDTEVISGRIDGKEVGNERESLEESIMEKLANNGGDVGSTENEAGQRIPRDKDGKKDEKKRKKRKIERDVGDTEVTSGRIDGKEVGNERESLEKSIVEKVAKNGGQMDSTESEAGQQMPRDKDGKKDGKKRKKHKIERDVGDTGVISGGIDGREAGNVRELLGENTQKKRKKKSEHNVDLENAVKIMDDKLHNDNSMMGENEHPYEIRVENGETKEHIAAASNKAKKKKKKKKKVESQKNSSEVKRFSETERKLGDEVTDASVRSTPKGASKRVSFSEDVEIFPSSDDLSDEMSVRKEEFVRGKRFSREEDELVKEAVLNYINNHQLGEEGLNMVLKCKNYPEVRNCWKEIGEALPWRPRESVYSRAHVLFERDENHKWTEEEYELVRKFHEKYGPDWRTLGDALGKHRFHVKDAWRRMNVANRKSGKWSQDEYQSLFDLVNMDLRMKAFEERKSKHGMLRDNICWTAISNKLGTRATPTCCLKWYDSLTSPMVAEGKWLDVDDYRLLIALYDVDACCMEDVDWDSLLEHRPGDVCRKRWNQMVKHLGELQNGSFADQVDVLMKRYCPDVLEAREAYSSKPVVD